MPEITVGQRRWAVAAGDNLLDALNAQGLNVPYSCRAGSCHACLVHCLRGEPRDNQPSALDAGKHAEGWRLACQCQVVEDLSVAVFDPATDGVPARVEACDWLSPEVLRLRLQPSKPLRYQAGQHLVLWTESGVARPYSLASLPQEDRFLEFHIDCRHPGAFVDVAKDFRVGDLVRLGELRAGALRYDPDWQDCPLWLLAAGTGLAPLYGILREALRQRHAGEIRLVHLARDARQHYLASELSTLAANHPSVRIERVLPEDFSQALAGLRPSSRRVHALVCGSPASVEAYSKRLFLGGVPRNQVLADVFTGREGGGYPS